jgi:hypothetical protein
MSTAYESKEWRKFLQPLVTGLVAFLAAATLYIQQNDSTSMGERLAVVENKVGGIDELRRDVTELSKNVYTLIGEIRAERRSR